MKKVVIVLLLIVSSIVWAQLPYVEVTSNDWVALLGDKRGKFRVAEIINISTKLTDESTKKVGAGKTTEGLKMALQALTLCEYTNELVSARRSHDQYGLRETVEKLKNSLFSAGVTVDAMKRSRQYLNSYLHLYQIPESPPPLGWMDVVGIYPGYSSKEYVNDLKIDSGRFDIGGYGIVCVDRYNKNNVLTYLFCQFGRDVLTIDISKQVPASNYEVFEVLVNGFTKKFGKPTTSTNQLKTNFGMNIESASNGWIDKFGNVLTVTSVANKVGQGLLILTSKEYLDEMREESRAADGARKF